MASDGVTLLERMRLRRDRLYGRNARRRDLELRRRQEILDRQPEMLWRRDLSNRIDHSFADGHINEEEHRSLHVKLSETAPALTGASWRFVGPGMIVVAIATAVSAALAAALILYGLSESLQLELDTRVVRGLGDLSSGVVAIALTTAVALVAALLSAAGIAARRLRQSRRNSMASTGSIRAHHE